MRRTSYFTCPQCGKRSYRTRQEAERALGNCCRKAENKHRAKYSVIRRQERRVYECDFTGYFHLTSMRSFDY